VRKSVFLVLCISLFSAQSSFAQSAFTEEQKEIAGDHFIIVFTGNDSFPRDVAAKAEIYYSRIATDLGYPRYSEFWTWDNRVRIFIYPDHDSYIKATKQPAWSQGVADYRQKAIASYVWSKGFVESLLPHEMAHLIFRDFVGFKGEIPRWLDEGVAQWAEEDRRGQIKQMAREYYNNDTLLSITDMMKLDITRISETDKVYIRASRTKKGDQGVLFLSAGNLVGTYYLQAASLVGFLIERYGSYSFADFCRQLRDGKGLEESLRFAYPTKIRDLEDLEKLWREYLEQS
jgi:hypothetical protein